MSDEDKPLEFSAKDLMPDWAQESSSRPKERKRPPREDGDAGVKGRGGNSHGDRRRHGGPGGGGRDRRGGGRDDRRGGGGRDDRRGGRDQRRGGARGRDDRRGGDFRNRPPEEKPLEGVTATLEPNTAAVEGLTKLIRETLRAYPLADLAKMVLKGRDRYQVRFKSDKGGPSLFRCEADGSLWSSRDEAVAHSLNSKAIETFYDVEIVEVEAPGGNFNVVAVCGMSGEILGPPNHHQYQINVARLHAERFSNMPIERFKSRIVMESGEEAIEKWKEQVTRVKHYFVKSDEPEPTGSEREGENSASEEEGENESAPEETTAETTVDSDSQEERPAVDLSEAGGSEEAVESEPESVAVDEGTENDEVSEEASEATVEDGASEDSESSDVAETSDEQSKAAEERVVLKSSEELARHFRQNFSETAIQELRNAVVAGDIPAKLLSPGLLVHLKQESEKLRRGFPLPMIQALCRAFEKQGLKFFKRGKKALHVSVVRPRAIDESVSLTDQVQAIVDYLVANPRSKVVDLLDALADDFTKPEKKKSGEQVEEIELTDGAKSVLSNLRWLAAEGFVIEFPDTSVAMGKPPRVAPAKKEPQAEPPKSPETKVDETSLESEKSEGEVAAEEPVVAPPSEATTGKKAAEKKSEALLEAVTEEAPEELGDEPEPEKSE